MAAIIRRKQNPILEEVYRAPESFNFFQCVRLLETDPIHFQFPKVRPRDAISFPSKDLSGCEFKNGRLHLEANFLGLFGVSSPLPHYFITYLLDNPEAFFLKAFLSVFNQLFYYWLYQAWKSIHPLINESQQAEDADTFQPFKSQNGDLISTKTRTLLGLHAVLKRQGLDAYYTLACQACTWKPLSEYARLGKHLRLNDNVVLGRSMLVARASVVITVSKLLQPEARFQLHQAIKHYLTDRIRYELRILTQSPAQASCIGADKIRIGHDTFIGAGQHTYYKGYHYVQ